MAEQYTFTDLSERLQGPEGDKVSQLCRTRLKELQDAVAKRLAGGLASDEYERHRRLADALAAAQRIMILLLQPTAKDARGGGVFS